MLANRSNFASLRAAAGAESARSWREQICSTFVHLDCMPSDVSAFFGEVSSVGCGDLQFSVVSSTSQKVMYSGQRRAADHEDVFLLALQVVGTGFATQEGRSAHQHPGDMTLYDTSGRYELGFERDFRQFVVKIPRTALARRIPQPEAKTGRLFSARQPSVRIASRFLNELAAEAHALPPTMALRSSELALDLISMALGMGEQSDEGDPTSTRQGALVQRVRYFIADNLSEPSLDPTAIAAAHGVSVRYLNMVLEQQGTSLGRLIQQMRIEACARDLSNPDQRQRSITAIAYAAGFNDSAHFSRVFRSHFGISPRDFRHRRLIVR